MVVQDFKVTPGLHPLPGYLADRAGASSGYSNFEQLDRQVVLLSKRVFIASNAMGSGSDEDVETKFKAFQRALEQYLLTSEELMYLPLGRSDSGALSKDATQAIAEFVDMKKRLRRFLKIDAKVAWSHRLLMSRALCKVDRMVMEQCTVEREVLYPVLSHTS